VSSSPLDSTGKHRAAFAQHPMDLLPSAFHSSYRPRAFGLAF